MTSKGLKRRFYVHLIKENLPSLIIYTIKCCIISIFYIKIKEKQILIDDRATLRLCNENEKRFIILGVMKFSQLAEDHVILLSE